jgi:SAM-dependent methyltransferase
MYYPGFRMTEQAPATANDRASLHGCLVCGGVGRLWTERGGRELWRCSRCGFAWVPQGLMRNPSGTSIYDDDVPIFFSDTQADYYRDDATVDAARAKVEWVRQYARSGGRLLDVGANFGHFLQQAAPYFDTIGIEPSRTVVEWGRENLDAPLEVGSIEHENAAFVGRFDAITLFDVIEHLPDPAAALRRCGSYLAPGGLIFITTPDADSVMARILGSHWYYVDLVEHISLFGSTNLETLLRQTGFAAVTRRTFGRRYRFSYIERRLRDLSRGSAPLKVAAWLARPLTLWPDRRISLNLGDVVGIVAAPNR